MLRNNVVEKVLRLLYRREKWLVVAAVRFLRTCIGLKDDFYNRYLVRTCLPSSTAGFHTIALPQFDDVSSEALDTAMVWSQS